MPNFYFRLGVMGRAKAATVAFALVATLAAALSGCAAFGAPAAPAASSPPRASAAQNRPGAPTPNTSDPSVQEPAEADALSRVRAPGGPRLKVLATFTVLADLVSVVGQQYVDVSSVTRLGAEIHGYEPTPSDVLRAQNVDLIVDNGLGLEAWFARFVADSPAQHVTLSDGVAPLPIGAHDSQVANPHAWMSPSATSIYVGNLAAALSAVDPEHSAHYAANARAYQGKLNALADHLSRAVETLPHSARLLVTCEGAFSYLAQDAGLREAYLWPVNSEAQASARTTVALAQEVTRSAVPAVFCESTVSDAGQRRVAEATGARLGGTLYVDSLSEPDGPVPTHLDLLRHDIDTIVAGLCGTGLCGTGLSQDVQAPR